MIHILEVILWLLDLFLCCPVNFISPPEILINFFFISDVRVLNFPVSAILFFVAIMIIQIEPLFLLPYVLND